MIAGAPKLLKKTFAHMALVTLATIL